MSAITARTHTLSAWQRADAIRALLDTPVQPEDRAQARRQERQIDGHQHAITAAYAAARGWTRSGRFLLDTLAEGKMHDGGRFLDQAGQDAPMTLIDHTTCWRIGRWPVAIVSQPYGYGADDTQRAEAREWATRHGLRLTFPVDFPSWWYPGWTVLVEITRAGPLA